MAYYLVRAIPISGKMEDLRESLDAEEFKNLRPFGPSLTRSLENARFDPEEGKALWEEEDYCTPPLREEREILERFFSRIEVEEVEKGEGWERIEEYPDIWSVEVSPSE